MPLNTGYCAAVERDLLYDNGHGSVTAGCERKRALGKLSGHYGTEGAA